MAKTTWAVHFPDIIPKKGNLVNQIFDANS